MADEITIIRASRGAENPYFMFRRATAQDHSLSFEARGVMAYLLSKPDDWTITLANLMTEGAIGRDKARRILGELTEARYLEQGQPRASEGKFGPLTYRLHEEPQPVTEKPSAVAPVTEKPSTDKPLTAEPLTANPHHTYKEILQNTESLQNTEETESSPSDSVTQPAREPAATVAANDDDDEIQKDTFLNDDFFDRAVQRFNLFADTRTALLALPRLDAVAVMLEAVRQARDGNGGGLLATMLRTGTGKTPDALRLAPLALELETLSWSVLVEAEAMRERTKLLDETWQQYQAHEADEPRAGESESAPVEVDRAVEQARHLWRVARGQLRIQLNRATYDGWLARVEASSYADNVLTLRAPNAVTRDHVARSFGASIARAVQAQTGLDDLKVEVVA